MIDAEDYGPVRLLVQVDGHPVGTIGYYDDDNGPREAIVYVRGKPAIGDTSQEESDPGDYVIVDRKDLETALEYLADGEVYVR